MKDEWNNALNVIRQQAAYLVQQCDEEQRKGDTARKASDGLRREVDYMRHRNETLPSGATRASLEDRIQELKRQVRDLENTVSSQREYMKLKDNAKIKVEQQRDATKHANVELRSAVARMKGDADKVQKLETQLRAQAQAFRELENRFEVEVRRRLDAEKLAKNVQDVLSLGVDGLRAEYARNEREF